MLTNPVGLEIETVPMYGASYNYCWRTVVLPLPGLLLAKLAHPGSTPAASARMLLGEVEIIATPDGSPRIAVDAGYSRNPFNSRLVSCLAGVSVAYALDDREPKKTALFNPTGGILAAWQVMTDKWGGTHYGRQAEKILAQAVYAHQYLGNSEGKD